MNKKAMSAIILAGAVSIGVVTPIASHASVTKKYVHDYEGQTAKVYVTKKSFYSQIDNKRIYYNEVQLMTKHGKYTLIKNSPYSNELSKLKNKKVTITGQAYTEYHEYYDSKHKKKTKKERYITVYNYKVQ